MKQSNRAEDDEEQRQTVTEVGIKDTDFIADLNYVSILFKCH